MGANIGRSGVEVGVEAGVGTGRVGRAEHGGGGGIRSHIIITDLFNLARDLHEPHELGNETTPTCPLTQHRVGERDNP